MCKVRLGVGSKAYLVDGCVCDHWDKLCVVSVDTPHSSFICLQLGSKVLGQPDRGCCFFLCEFSDCPCWDSYQFVSWQRGVWKWFSFCLLEVV